MPAFCTIAAAATPDVMVITATRTAKPRNDVLAQLTTISREEIIDSGAATLTDLLQRRANLDIRATGGPGQSSGVFIRGTNSTHALVLIDGQRIASSTTGASALESISLDMIDRIEVVRGPLSGLYGSDAIGGVIQIFTRSPSANDSRITASAGGGSLSAGQFEAGLQTVVGDTRVALNASHRRIDPPSASNPAAGSFIFHPDRDPSENTSATLKLVHQLWQGEVVTFNAWASSGKTHYDAGPGNNARINQTLSGVQLVSSNTFTEFWQSRLSLGSTTDNSRFTTNTNTAFKTSQQQLSWQNDFVTAAGDTVLGVERREEKVTSTTRYTNLKRTTDAVYGAVTQKVDTQTLSLTARHDREDQFGSRRTGSLTWGWQLWNDELVYLSAGKAFRAPSFNDLYFPGFSNPLLKPEQSESGEFGWRLTRPNLLFNLAVFENRIDDLIAFDSATSRPQNIRRARIRGWELGVDTRWLTIDWRARVTAQRPEDTDTNKQLRSRAKLLGSLSAARVVGAWQFGADVTASGVRFDSTNEAPTSRMAGYALLGAFARYRFDREWNIELVGNNLTDRRYELARGYNQLGRQLQLNVRFSSR